MIFGNGVNLPENMFSFAKKMYVKVKAFYVLKKIKFKLVRARDETEYVFVGKYVYNLKGSLFKYFTTFSA